ncbi:MAG TPA: GNAT family N-acetyltransferase, partial [Candidatus Limnocylindrales bacterium]|nr:GNAT family N-acetyltransferase [Candidatus Limnocylindrales bacterium]
PVSGSQAAAERQSLATAHAVRSVVVPRLVAAAVDRGWGRPLERVVAPAAIDDAASADDPAPTILPEVDVATWERVAVAGRVASPADPRDVHAIVRAALMDGAAVSAAIAGGTVVALALSASGGGGHELLALGVAPAYRRKGLGARLLADHLAALQSGATVSATITVAERDPIEPLPLDVRMTIARSLLVAAGFEVRLAEAPLGRIDSSAIVAVRG